MVYMFDKRLSFTVIIVTSVLIGYIGVSGSGSDPMNIIMKNLTFLFLPAAIIFLTASYYAFESKSNLWGHELILSFISLFFGFTWSLFNLIDYNTITEASVAIFLYFVVYAVISGICTAKARKINPNSNYWKFLAVLCALSVVGIPFILSISTGSRVTCYLGVRNPMRGPPELAMSLLFSLRKKGLRERLRKKGIVEDGNLPEEKGLLSRWFE